MTLEQASVARLKAGDIGGLAALVEVYQVRAVRTAYLILRDRSLAEDISQAAFIRAYERIGQFDAAAPFGPWFLRSVANDAIKAVERRRITESVDEAADADPDRRQGGVFVDERPGPAALAELAEDATALWALLGRLPAKQLAVIVLRYYAGLSDVEIADQLDTSRATVRWRLFAARGRLRTWLGEQADR